MNWERIVTLARKDLKEVRGNRAVWLPMLVVPSIFVIIMPIAMLVGANYAGFSQNEMQEMSYFLERLPPEMTLALQGMNNSQMLIYLMLGYLLAPLFLVMPVMFSSIIAAESFAGERERKTMESLLYTPASDSELFLGKVLAAFVPALLVTWFSFLVYILVLNLGGSSIMGRWWFPLPAWWPMIFWITPALSVLGVGTTVLISLKVNTFMEAYQLGAMLVMVVLAILAGQMTGVLAFSIGTGMILGLVIWLCAVIVIRFSVARFQRDSLISRL